MNVQFSRLAEQDLENIGDHIAVDDPLRAESFVDELRERCLSLDRFPDRFPSVRSIGGKIVRKLTHGKYIVFYSRRSKAVEILRIVHGARYWSAFLEGLE